MIKIEIAEDLLKKDELLKASNYFEEVISLLEK